MDFCAASSAPTPTTSRSAPAWPYFLSAAPNSSFAFPAGQGLSRTTYAALFALMGTTYGAGDGSTTFNLPSLGGRFLACRANMNGAGVEAHHLGRVGHPGHDTGRDRRRAETSLLGVGEIPSHTHANALSDPGHGARCERSYACAWVNDPTHTHGVLQGASTRGWRGHHHEPI